MVKQVLEKHWKDVTRAILITALLFSMIHMNPYWFAQIYILGVLLGFIAWKTKSVIPALVLHGMNNAMAMVFAFVDLEKNSFYILSKNNKNIVFFAPQGGPSLWVGMPQWIRVPGC